MTTSSLPVELLDEILGLAVALGTISPNEATHICRRWRSFQMLLFRSVKLDPFDENILDLDDHSHLIPYIKELRVGGVVHSDSSSPSNVHDLSPSFTKFLCNVDNPLSMLFCESRIQWTNVSSRSIDAFLTVFRRDSFRSLEVSVHKPFPSWMLLRGLGVASKLTIHCIGQIIPPLESAGLLSYQCSLTRLILFGNAAVKWTAEFCSRQRELAKALLRKVICLVMEYGEMPVCFGPPISPQVEVLVVFLGPQLETLDIRIRSSNIPPLPILQSALGHLKVLQHLSIHFMGCSTGNGDTLITVKQYMRLVLCGLPSSSLIKSLFLRVCDQRKLEPGADFCERNYEKLVQHISKQLLCASKWPHLTSSHIVVDVSDGNLTVPTRKLETTRSTVTELEIISLLQVNVSTVEQCSSLGIPQMD